MRVHQVQRINTSDHLFAGGMLILVGFLFLLDTMGIADTGYFISKGWPLILVAIGAKRIISADSNEGRLTGGLIAFIGGLFLLSRLGYMPFSVWGLLWPVMLMSSGLYLVMRRRYLVHAPSDSSTRVNAMAIMSGVERRFASQQFEGGELTAALGGCEIDLREAEITGEEAVIEVFVLAGGIELIVPQNWIVVSKLVPILAALDDNTRPAKESTKRLVIRGLLIMGGVEVKN